jgi:thioredoxin-like negative regulator of GroEL
LSTFNVMNDEQIHETITKLVADEHHLRAQSDHTEAERAELAEIETSLDQCWDLLRQRQALRDVGRDPDQAAARPITEVEGYQQ